MTKRFVGDTVLLLGRSLRHIARSPDTGNTDFGSCAQAQTGSAQLPSNVRCVDVRKFHFTLHHARRARVVKVGDYKDERGAFRQFKSGGVSHGRQWTSDDPAKRREATAYYAPETGAGRSNICTGANRRHLL